MIVEDPQLITALREYFRPINFNLVPAEIRSVASKGFFGHRCCIDTISLMSEGEGMLLGSSPDAYFLVHAETRGSEFTRSREFRVNAGPASNYVITDKKEEIKYLADFEPLKRGNVQKIHTLSCGGILGSKKAVDLYFTL